MADYKIIDEIGPAPEKKPWNPMAVFLFTVIAGPIVGGCMGILNCDRLGIRGHKKSVMLFLITAAIMIPLLPVLGLGTFGKGLMMDISEEIAIGLRFVLGFYLIGTQKDHFERHIEMGGNTADLLVPVIFAILFMVSAPNIDIAMLMDAGNQSSNLSRRGNIFEPDKTPGAPYAAQRKNITAFAGSPPYVDGVVDEKDGWNEGENIISRTRDEVYNITVKHDFENLYILIEWEGPLEWQDGMAIYFEQDEEKPDFNLSNGRVDNYYQGDIKYGPDNFRDAHYNYSGYNVKETQNGKLKTGYVDGMWSQEWQLPLRSQDQFDIYIDKYPTQLGFSIINRKGAPYGIFPVNAWFSRPESWGMMKIVDSKKQ